MKNIGTGKSETFNTNAYSLNPNPAVENGDATWPEKSRVGFQKVYKKTDGSTSDPVTEGTYIFAGKSIPKIKAYGPLKVEYNSGNNSNITSPIPANSPSWQDAVPKNSTERTGDQPDGHPYGTNLPKN